MFLWFSLPHRFNSDLSKYCDIMSGEQRPGVRDVGAQRPQVLPDSAHGASGPPRGVLEATRLRRLGSQTGENKKAFHTGKYMIFQKGGGRQPVRFERTLSYNKISLHQKSLKAIIKSVTVRRPVVTTNFLCILYNFVVSRIQCDLNTVIYHCFWSKVRVKWPWAFHSFHFN